MEPLAVFCYSHRSGYLPILEEQLRAQRVGFVSQKLPTFSWRLQQLWLMEVAKANPNRLLVVLGAWDTVFVGTKDELGEIDPDVIWLAGDTRCWPDKAREAEYLRWQGKVATQWPYVNTGPMTGRGRRISQAMEWGWKKFPIEGDSLSLDADNDMRFWTDMYLRSPFDLRIDHETKIGMCTSGVDLSKVGIQNGRILNLEDHTRPLFCHANGPNSINHRLLHWESP